MNVKTKKIVNGLFVFLLGVIALVASSYTRTFSAEYIQFPVIFTFFLLCGWLLNRFFKKLLPYPFLFMFPTVVILVAGFISNKNGFFHFLGELFMIVPGFFIGFYFFRWSKKTQLFAAFAIPLVYFFYISKLNPLLNYYNNSVRNKSIKGLFEDPLPNFQFIKPDSSLFSLNRYNGKVILLDFYFNGCVPCRKKMPALLRIKEYYKENNDFLLLAVHKGGSESFSSFIGMLNSFPTGLDFAYDSASTAVKYLGINGGYPLEVLIDKSGRVRDQFAGYNADVALIYEKTTIKKIDALLNEKH